MGAGGRGASMGLAQGCNASCFRARCLRGQSTRSTRKVAIRIPQKLLGLTGVPLTCSCSSSTT
jgi:hypothetical protein